MTTINSGSAVINIQAVDNTTKAFTSAAENINSFGSVVKSLEQNMKPIRELLKNGIYASGSIAALGLLNSNCTTLNDVVQALTGGFNNLSNQIGVFSAQSEKSNSVIAQLLGNINTSVIAQASANIMAIITAIDSSMSIIVTLSNNWGLWVQSIINCITSMGAFLTAIAANTAAQYRQIIATRAAQAAMDAYFNRLATLHVLYMRMIASQTAYQLTCERTTASVLQLTASTTANTSSSIIDVSARTAQTTALTTYTATARASSIWTGILSAAQTAWATITAACTAAWRALTLAMAANPFGAILVGVTLLITGITALVSWWRRSSESARQSAKEQVDACKNMVEEIDNTINRKKRIFDADNAKLERLKQIDGKGYKTEAEIQEAKKYIKEMSMYYKNLGISINETTGEISGLNQKNEINIKKQQALQRLADLQTKRKELQTISSTSEDKKEREEAEIKKQQVEVEISYYESGGIENISGKSKADMIQMKIDAEKKNLEAVAKLQGEILKINADGLKFQNDMEKTMRQEKMNAMQKELAALKEQIQARKTILITAIAEGKANFKTFVELYKIGQLEKKRQAQIQQRYKKESDEYLQTFKNSEKEQNRKKAQDALNQNLSRRIEENPLEAMGIIQKMMNKAGKDVDRSLRDFNKLKAKSAADGFIDDKEKTAMNAAWDKYQRALQKQEGLQAHATAADKKVQDAVAKTLKATKNGRLQTPIDAIQKGSVEAYKQAMANANRTAGNLPPEAKEVQKVGKIVEKRFNDAAKMQRETNALTRQVVQNLKGV